MTNFCVFLVAVSLVIGTTVGNTEKETESTTAHHTPESTTANNTPLSSAADSPTTEDANLTSTDTTLEVLSTTAASSASEPVEENKAENATNEKANLRANDNITDTTVAAADTTVSAADTTVSAADTTVAATDTTVVASDTTEQNTTGTLIPENATETTVDASSNATTPELLKLGVENDTKLNEVDDNDEIRNDGWEYENSTYVDTRRILYSKSVKPGARPYMVYLQLTKESAKAHKYRGWLCGGVIVDKNYVLTSAACVEDADRFYIVSGTIKFVDSFDYKSNDCVCKNRRKVVWKCIPKNYKFDFQDSIKWSSNDIAIVKTDRPFKLNVKEKGCDFAAQLICYNNISRELEKPGTKAFIAGWGSGSNFREGVYRRQKEVHIPQNAKCLQEAKVCIMDNEQCAKKWAQKFRSIITQYMICTKDVMKRLSELCEKKYANCTDVETRRLPSPEQLPMGQKVFNIDLGRHLRDPNDYTARRSSLTGGFCENDHGGPLIVKYQGKERVIGVISACKIDPKTHSCHGPFLYTSVFKNRQFISCAINKDTEDNCRRVFRTGITHEEWDVSWDDYVEEEGGLGADKKEDPDTEIAEVKRAAKEPEIENEEIAEAAAAKPSVTRKETEENAAVVRKKVKTRRTHESDNVEGTSKESADSDTAETTPKSKRKSHKRSSRSSKKKSKKSKKEGKKIGRSRKESKEVVYESSRDDAVNDPTEDE